jgi:hypothetical protein
MPGILALEVIVLGGSADRIEAQCATVEARDGAQVVRLDAQHSNSREYREALYDWLPCADQR